MEEGGQGTVHHVNMLWHEPNKGWASLDEEPNTFGLQQSLTVITLETKENMTLLNWDMHFNAKNEEVARLNVSSLEQALNNDIAQNLTKRFGGRILESYIEGKTK